MFKALDEILRIESVRGQAEVGAPFGRGPRAALDWFLAKAREFGLECGDMDGYCGYAEYGDKLLPCVGVVAHLDVVPAGSGWDFDPYQLTIKDGYLYGRGVVDDKGPIVAALFALKNIKDKGLKLNKRIRLIVGCDEESGSECMRYYSEHGDIPLMSFTPDADFPIINSEKGILRLKITMDKDACLLSNQISITGGTTINVVPPFAKLTVPKSALLAAKLPSAVAAWNKNATPFNESHAKKPDLTLLERGEELVLEAHGVAGHAMAPDKADNALWKIFGLLSGMGADCQCSSCLSANCSCNSCESNCASCSSDQASCDTSNCDKLAGACATKNTDCNKANGLCLSDLTDCCGIIGNIAANFCHAQSAQRLGIADFDEESGDLTLSMDIVEDLGDKLALSLDIRYPRTSDAQTIQNNIAKKLPKGAQITVLNGEPPLFIAKDSLLVSTLLRVYSQVTGKESFTKYCGGGTYARRLPNTIAFGPTFPDAVTNIHNINERISKEEFELLPKIYQKAMEELSK